MKPKPKQIRQTFEARYEKGYRYLDRCGEAMLILEDALPDLTGKVWMPEEISPAGARLKCPELDAVVVFDASHLVVEQNPIDVSFDFAALARLVHGIVAARFDIRVTVRFGGRGYFMVGTDSIDDAEKLARRLLPLEGWPVDSIGQMKLKAGEVVALFESEEGESIRIAAKPSFKVEAPLTLDDRLKMPVKLLPAKQPEALLDQLKRRKQREEDPVAGVLLDVDYAWIRPAKPEVEPFLKEASGATEAIITKLMERS